MSFVSDMKVLYHMVLRPVRGKDHAARMESFYGGQADAYDGFRKRLLRGREELYKSIDVPEDGVWVDMGGGTGSNLECIGDDIRKLKKAYVVDLAGSLLEVASKRMKDRGWDNAEAVEADATTWTPPEGQADVVTFSYSLTMIPDWFDAIENARRILKPGGRIGVVDFYVSRKHPDEDKRRHGWPTRSFWPVWFASDNVFPSADHAPFLHRRFEAERFDECSARVPYFPMPWWHVPYYRFVGKKG